MARPRARRWLLGLGATAAVLLVAALVAARLLPREQVRDRLVAQVRQATGGEAAVARVGVGLGRSVALHLADGRLSGTGAALAAATGRPNRLRGYAVELSTVDANLALGPLLRREAVITSLRLRAPHLQLTADDGAELTVDDAELALRDLRWRPAAVADAGGPPPDLAFAFDLRAARVTRAPARWDELQASGELAGGVLAVPAITARWGGGTVRARLTADYARDPDGELEFACDVAGVPAADLLAAWVPDLAARLTCALDAALSGRCGLRDGDTALATLDLTGEVNGAAGVLRAGDWLAEVAPYLGRRQDLLDVRFDELRHRLSVKDGRYHIESLELPGADTDWRGAGWFDFGGQMAADLHVKLPAGFTPELGAWSFLAATLRDAEGRVNLDLKVSGPVAAPRVAVDLAGLLGGGAAGEGGSQKGLGGFLDKWKTR